MTPISDERLAEMLAEVEIEFDNALLDAEADQNPQLAVDPVGEFDLIELRSILSELQSLRAQGGVRVKPLFDRLVDAYARGIVWQQENPGGEVGYAGKAAYDYADKITSSLEASPAPVSELVEASCPGCRGTGDQGGNPSYGVCDDCNGTGKVGQPLPAALAAKGGQ